MSNRKIILFFTIMFMVVLYKFFAFAIPYGTNFSPLQAAIMCGFVFLPFRLAVVIPFFWIISVIAENLFVYDAIYTSFIFSLVLINILFFLISSKVRNNLQFKTDLKSNRKLPGFNYRDVLKIIFGSVMYAVVFYLITNTMSWFSNPTYEKSIGGLVQSLTVGLPGYPPTYIFFRNSLLSNLFFTSFFIAVYQPQLLKVWLAHRRSDKMT